MQCAVQTHRDWAFRVGGVIAVAVLLWWPASAYGSASPAALQTGGRTPVCPCTDLRAAFSHPPTSCDTAAFVDAISTGAWVGALQYVGYPNPRGIMSRHRQEQAAVCVAQALHVSR